MPSQDHRKLMSVLNKMANADKWRKMPKKKDKVKSITLTKTQNIRITFDDNSKAYVLKKNKNLFERVYSSRRRRLNINEQFKEQIIQFFIINRQFISRYNFFLLKSSNRIPD